MRRYSAAEKHEIIRTIEASHLPIRTSLNKIGIPKTTFYRWLDRYSEYGPDGLEDLPSRPAQVWNRIPEAVQQDMISFALEAEHTELSPRELAVAYTDARGYFLSESAVYRLLKAQDLITSPAYVVIKAAEEFRDKTTAINQLWY